MRIACLPRKARHQWVIFLVLFCLLGVYLTYRRMAVSKFGPKNPQRPRKDANFEQIQAELKNQVKKDLKLGKIVIDPSAESKVIKPEDRLVNGRKADRKPEAPEAIPAGRVLVNDDDYISNEEKLARLKLLVLQLSPADWKSAPDPDEMILLTKSEFMDLDISSQLSCREIDMLVSNNRQMGHYGKKFIDYMKLSRTSETEMALKSVGNDQQFKISCMKQDYNIDRCQSMGNYKLVKELVLLNVLEHPALIKVLGFCLRGDTIDMKVNKKGVVVVTEIGRVIEQGTLSSMPWPAKLQMARQVLNLLQYLEGSPLGSLGFDQLQTHDFLIVGSSNLRLIDLDNLNIGEPSCTTDSECRVSKGWDTGIRCVNNICKGFNSQKNLKLVITAIILPLLQHAPSGSQKEVDQFLDKVNNFKVTSVDARKWVMDQIKKAEQDLNLGADLMGGSWDGQGQNSDNHDKRAHQGDSVGQGPGKTVGWGKQPGDDPLKFEPLQNNNLPDANDGAKFDRLPNANFPAMMTAVMKNSVDSAPDENYGATMFRKRPKKSKVTSKPKENNADGGNNTRESCIARVLDHMESGRARREKRLYTHLGMKDIPEKTWLQFAYTLMFSHNLGPSQLSINSTRGGRLKLQFDENAVGLKRGEYMLEYGRHHYHVAYLALYHLDRILGLYHVPPAIARAMSKAEYTDITGHRDHMEKLANFSTKEGRWLQGVLTAAIPPVMKLEKLTVPRLETLPSDIPEFSRTQKLQLEYLLLATMSKMGQPTKGYYGYKGHLIHFEADLAFTNSKKLPMDYFYNCQFPNTVYKTLNCYRCSEDKKMAKICGLGAEVVQRIKNAGFTDSEVMVGSLSARDLANMIDNSASSVLHVVEHCIRSFSREEVIY
ncbi:uncharacterized protein LOC128230575 isoform X2 [Mya arenaria]|uniref:uncharacterized protein LOC128230575 isoform X2 n=1 Tax=Mya arenaria TaxID=6604 RepID=UPI0022E04DE5|nr:uncharacterized protein LOC128230575 isoform X2 [Mya arenaria]